MIIRDIRKLLEKLDDYLTRRLEGAIGYCVNRTHYEVRWEHIFMDCLDAVEGDIPAILRRFGIESARLKKALDAELESMRSGNSGKPSFSPQLMEALELAWFYSSINYGLGRITSGTLLMAMIEKGQLSLTTYASLLSGINLETLKNEYPAIVKASVELAMASGESSGEGSGASGAQASGAAGQDVLTKYCTNFTQLARDGKVDPILGRDEEIRQAIDILNRRRKNNPILVGEAGVGKTAIVEGMALQIAKGDVPDNMKNIDLWGLDLGLLQAGASVKGEFEKRLKSVIDAIKGSPKPTILFIDEAHTLVGAGGAAGQNDAANLLKPALARGELRTMAATTWSEYRKYFEKDPALARRFQLIKIEEPDEQKGCIMLRGVAASFERYHNVKISADAIKSAVSLSHRYISGRQLPDKAVDVLDTSAARVKMSQTVPPGSLDFARKALTNAQLELKKLTTDKEAGITIADTEAIGTVQAFIDAKIAEITSLESQWEAEKKLALQIGEVQTKLAANPDDAATRAQLDTLMKNLAEVQGEHPMVFPFVSPAVCGQVISDWTGIPIGSMVKDEAQTLLRLEERLSERIVGQNDALCEIANSIRASKTGMGNPDAPIGVFLFAGPSGVGKTETANALADLLFGGERFMTVINMSEYQEKHTVSQLKGSPPGYVGYGEGGILTEAVRQKPYSIVVLDEIEKAHVEVMNLFYQVFDKGFMRDGEGREINFRNTIIVMTSNMGSVLRY
jgi:type VI secretion system protein VasG